MWMLVIKAVVGGLTVALVSEIGGRFPKLGAVILTLPVVSIITFIALWQKEAKIEPIMTFARQTLILVPLGLGFFVPLAYAKRFGLTFWPAFGLGVVIATITIVLWLRLGPKLGQDAGRARDVPRG